MQSNSLPNNWISATLDEVCEIILGQSPPSETYNTEGIGLPFYQGKAEFGNLYPTPVKWCSAPKKIAESGDILISVRAPVGPTNLCPEKSCIGRGLAAIRPLGDIPNKYVLYYLRYIENEWDDKATGTTFKAITGKILKTTELPLAPQSEQSLIVRKIEKLFSQLDAGLQDLNRVQANLARYKASVLNAACEGRLVPTEAELARAEGRDYESGEELLQRILAERKKKWEEEQHARGNDPSKMKYKEADAPDTEGLPELPEGWVWATVEQACDRIVDCLHSTPEYVKSGYYCVDANWIKPGRLVFQDARYVDEKTFVERNRRMVPQDGDVLFSREGALLGVAVRVPRDIKICLGQRMMIFRPGKGVHSIYFESILNSPTFKNQYASKITGTAAPHLNIRDIRKLCIQVPPTNEQYRIVNEVEQQLTCIQELEKTVSTNLRRIERLRQAILKRAFEGKLVPQDAEDEPASKLLEQIGTQSD